MKKMTLILVLALGIGLCELGFAGELDQPVRLEVELTDGSRLIGITPVTSMVVHTSFNSFQVPLSQLSNLQIQPDRETAIMQLRNGDQLTGVPGMKDLLLTTVFGDQTIGIQNINRIRIRTSQSLPADLAELLVLYYPFDVKEQDQVTDRSSKGNRGTVIGPQFTPQGRSGGALSFDGIDDYVEVGNPPSLQLTANFTLAAWIWPERSQGSLGIFTKTQGYPEQHRRSFEFGLGPDDAMFAYFWDSSTRFFTGVVKNPLIPRQEWTHMVLLHDSTLPDHQMRAYINGIPCEMIYGYETVASVPIVRNVSEPLRIGCVRPGIEHFKGRIDEVMIFSRCLSADDIRRLYQCLR